jgi:hypothetical protein
VCSRGCHDANVEAIPIVQTPRNFVIRRPKVCKEIRCGRDPQRTFEFSEKSNLRSIDTESGKDFLPKSRRRAMLLCLMAPSWEPQEEGVKSIAARFSLS